MRVTFKRFVFELIYEDKIIYCCIIVGSKMFSFEKKFKQTCAHCKRKVHLDSHTMRLCEKCMAEYIESWRQHMME
jgi:Zn finger protein HypA/HybF involved in hydrogenase expression